MTSINQWKPIGTENEIETLALLANEIWHEYFPCILTDAQIDYMVETFQSAHALRQQIENGYQYYILYHDAKTAGYFGVCPKPDGSLFLSKFYLKQEFRGRGIATAQFQEVQRLAQQMGASHIWLTVNKHNQQAIAVYQHFGMEKIRDEVTEIGHDFVMDDFVFSIPVKGKTS